jgi:hypothetical protein
MALENQLEQLAGSRIPAAKKPTLTADASGSTDGSSNDEVRPTAPCMAEVGQLPAVASLICLLHSCH